MDEPLKRSACIKGKYTRRKKKDDHSNCVRMLTSRYLIILIELKAYTYICTLFFTRCVLISALSYK